MHDELAFGPHEYAELRDGTRRSAAVVVPVVQAIVGARSMVDVGGGEGWWAAEFARMGVHAVSIDEGIASQRAPGVEHVQHDLSTGVPESVGRFDLALCLEVAEHLDADAGDRLVEGLCAVAPAILFSAAVPGQGGHGHRNEQWPSYWVERFTASSFSCTGALRWRFWTNAEVEPWYRQNLLLAAREPSRFAELFDTPLAVPWAVVHPGTLARALGDAWAD